MHPYYLSSGISWLLGHPFLEKSTLIMQTVIGGGVFFTNDHTLDNNSLQIQINSTSTYCVLTICQVQVYTARPVCQEG